MYRELVARTHSSRPARDIPPVENEPARPQHRFELRIAFAESANEGAHRNALRWGLPSDLGLADREPGRREEKDSHPDGHAAPKPAHL